MPELLNRWETLSALHRHGTLDRLGYGQWDGWHQLIDRYERVDLVAICGGQATEGINRHIAGQESVKGGPKCIDIGKRRNPLAILFRCAKARCPKCERGILGSATTHQYGLSRSVRDDDIR